MVSYLAGLCEFCGESDSLATPEECKAAGLDIDVAACRECLKRMNPAAEGAPPAPPPKPHKPS